jgi:hypothetical protein
MLQQHGYIPGVCNIGKAEVRQRWIAAWVGLVLSAAALLWFISVPVAWYLKLLIFLPAVVGATSLQQALFQFCVKFGFEGVFNFGAEVGKTDSVEMAEYRRRDKAKALRMVVVGLLTAIVITAIALLLPTPA